MERHGVSRNTIRLALGALTNEGLITSSQGRGYFVRERAPLRFFASRTDSRERRSRTTRDAFMSDVAEQGRAGDLSIEVAIVRADPTTAARLELDEGATVVVRRRIQYVDGQPYATADTYFPHELVRDTPITEPDDIPQGANKVLDELGHAQVRFQDEITLRMPTTEEAATLQIGPGTPSPASPASATTPKTRPCDCSAPCSPATATRSSTTSPATSAHAHRAPRARRPPSHPRRPRHRRRPPAPGLRLAHRPGITDQWVRPFPPEAIAPLIDRGEVYLATHQGQPIATFTLTYTPDAELWNHPPDDAGYLRRLAVDRGDAGHDIGAQLLDHAGQLVAATGRPGSGSTAPNTTPASTTTTRPRLHPPTHDRPTPPGIRRALRASSHRGRVDLLVASPIGRALAQEAAGRNSKPHCSSAAAARHISSRALPPLVRGSRLNRVSRVRRVELLSLHC